MHLNFRLENNRLRGGTWIEGDLFDSDRWQDLQGHQPFFAQVNFPNVERGVRLFHGQWTHNDRNPKCADPAKIELPPYYPDTPVVREDWAGYLDSVSGLDVQVGWVLKQLEQEGLADDTVVIFFADNGRLEARGLDWCYDSGLHVPLIIRWPRDYPIPVHFHSATASDQLISLIDVTATTLTVGEVRRPESMHGRVLLGPLPSRRVDTCSVAGPHGRSRQSNPHSPLGSISLHPQLYAREAVPAPHVYKEVALSRLPCPATISTRREADPLRKLRDRAAAPG